MMEVLFSLEIYVWEATLPNPIVIMTLLFSSPVTSGRTLNHSKPQFSFLLMVVIPALSTP